MAGTQADHRNALLRKLHPADFDRLAPHLKRVMLDVRKVLEKPNAPIDTVYFPEAGLASIVARISGSRDIEVGITGRDGMTGTAVVLGCAQSPHSTFMQMAGWGWALPAEVLAAELQESVTLRALLLRFVQALSVQTAFTAVANGRCTLEERLARWLLMAHDRIDGSEVRLTHEFLSVMLGVRRAGVTVGMHVLEGKGLIRANRGQVLILDREGLVAQANGAYGGPEVEYRRLLGES